MILCVLVSGTGVVAHADNTTDYMENVTDNICRNTAYDTTAASTLSVPDKPVIKEVFTATSDSITFSWKKVTGASGYRVYKKVNSKWTKIKTISDAGKNSYTDKELKSGKTYCYKIKAYTESGGKKLWSSYSSTVKLATQPDKVKISNISYTYNSVKLSWSKVSGTGYQIYQKEDGSSNWKKVAIIKNSKTTSYRIGRLKQGTKYSFKIRAYVEAGTGKKIYGKSVSKGIATKSHNYVKNKLLHMSLYEKVCQMFIVTPEALTGSSTDMTTADSELKKAIESYPVGGIIYFSANLESETQTKNMIKTTQSYSKKACGINMFICVDEEGGTVARCAGKLGTTTFRNMAYYGSRNSKSEVKQIGETIGSDISSFGFNVDFAPVADVNINSKNELGNRIFSSNPDTVSSLTASFIEGIQGKNVSGTLKHFPGLGAADGNTHSDGYVYIDRTKKQLQANEFVAFQGGITAGADFVMVGHQITSAAGDNMPSDLSKTVVTDWLKTELGFTGIAITDSHSMNTITARYDSGTAAIIAIQAGIDIVLMPEKPADAIKAVYKAVKSGKISEKRIDDGVSRILTVKYKRGLI
jgi:beta-glucosidase-like glycosyl hydrolase